MDDKTQSSKTSSKVTSLNISSNIKGITNPSDQNEKTSKFFLFFLILLIIIGIILILIVELLINKLLKKFLFTFIITIPFQIILHLLVIRYLVLKIIFACNFFLLMRSMTYDIGKTQAKILYNKLHKFHGFLSLFVGKRGLVDEIKDFELIEKQYKSIQKIIDHFIKLFTKMQNKFKLSKDQKKFYENLNLLNDKMNESKVLDFINTTVNNIKTNNKQALSELDDKLQNEFIFQLSSNEIKLQPILVCNNILMDQLVDFIGNNYCCFSYRYLRNFLKNDLFGSIQQFHCELDNFFTFEEKKLKTKDNKILEYIIIKNKNNFDSKKLIIICGPNGSPYQIFSRNIHLDIYLKQNIDVLCWNYRGYGFSTGKPNFNNLRNDILEIFDEIKKFGKYEHFAVHGISIGGLSCCHLAKNRNEIELLVCDRNFGNIDNIAKSYSFGKYLYLLYKILFIPSSDNVDNYIKANCYKIVLNDPEDDVVKEFGSLKSMIAKEICNKYLISTIFNNNDDKIIVNNKNNNEMEYLKNNNLNKNKKNNIEITTLDKLLGSNNDKKIFIKSLINISKYLTTEKSKSKSNNIFIRLFNKLKNKTFNYSDLKEEELQNTSGIFDLVKTHMEEILRSFESGGDTLYTLLTLNKDFNKLNFLENFFNNLFIWGTKNKELDNLNNLAIYSTSNIKKNIDNFIQIFDEFLNSQEFISSKKFKILKDIGMIFKYFEQIQNSLKFMGVINKTNEITRLVKNNGEVNNEYEENLIRVNRGHLVSLSCGHNGNLNEEEEKTFEKYLNESEFFKTKESNDESNDNKVSNIKENSEGYNKDEINKEIIDIEYNNDK